jgi:DNA-binding NarL/FixJ family response regulator
MAVRVLLADDHQMFRQTMSRYLNDQHGIEVIAEARNGEEALDKVKSLNPDVVIMDVHMPEVDGVRATRDIMELENPPAVVLLTMSKQDDYLFQAIKAGAQGYHQKDEDVANLIEAIRLAADGEMMLSPEMAQRVLQEFRKMATSGSSKKGMSALGDREIDILRLVTAGYTNQQIAEALGLAEKTIKNQLSIIFTKLELKNRTQAAIFALRHGLVTLEEL